MIRLPVLFILFMVACNEQLKENEKTGTDRRENKLGGTSLVILGTVQDGGSPHIGCVKKCCENLFANSDPARKVISLGLIDPATKSTWLFEASPDFPSQLRELNDLGGEKNNVLPSGIFLSHAHIGHYTGLMYLGREAMNAKEVKIYAMPRMKTFLETNGPWSQLDSLRNILILPLQNETEIQLNDHLKVKPFLVPHRDEYSETVGFIISGSSKKALFIPDIDKWSKWSKNIAEEIKKVDYAFIDGTFFSGEEINNRNISEIPHPFVIESIDLFKDLSPSEKNKVNFIHFNHSNPLLESESKERKQVLSEGFHLAGKGDLFEL